MKKLILIATSLIILLTLTSCSSSHKYSYNQDLRFDSAPEGSIKAMTFNIRVDTFLDVFNRWKTRKDIAVNTINNNAADIIGIQEGLRSQVQDLHNSLPQYNLYSAGRSDGKQKGETCALFYRKDRFELINSGTFWFSKTPEKPGSKNWGNIPPRICSYLHLTDKSTDKSFYVYNLHLDNLSQNSRKKSINLLAQRVSNRPTNDPFIIMGDFNMEMDNPAMVNLLQNKNYPKMVDAWNQANPGIPTSGTRHGFNGKKTGPTIDHMPVSEGAIVLDVKIDHSNRNGKYPSDHFPVIATIKLPDVI